MNLLSDIITYVRRIIKSPNNSVISDNLIIDFINRFYISDVDARIQLFDLKTKYQFQTTPGIDQYNMPLYNPQIEPGNQTIGMYPVYQGLMEPCFINGVRAAFSTERNQFQSIWWQYNQPFNTSVLGNGTAGPYTFNLPFFPPGNSPPNNVSGIIPGHVDISGIIATGLNQDPPYNTNFATTIPVTSVNSAVFFTATGANGQNIVVADSGQFLSNVTDGDLYGILMVPGTAPFGNSALPNGGSLPGGPYAMTQNTINYTDGFAQNVYFPTAIPAGTPINVQCSYFTPGLGRSVLWFNNTLTIRPPPWTQMLVELDAYLTPAAFLNTGAAIQFAYMAEYIARGAARKLLSDTGDQEQFMFYEPLFREQEVLVWKRSQRQFTSTRTQTIFSHPGNQGNGNQNLGQGGW